MAGKDKNDNDFESRFFDLLEGVIKGIDQKVDAQAGDIKAIWKAFGRFENKLKLLDAKLTAMPKESIFTKLGNNKLLYLALLCVLVFLLILAQYAGVKVPTL